MHSVTQGTSCFAARYHLANYMDV